MSRLKFYFFFLFLFVSHLECFAMLEQSDGEGNNAFVEDNENNEKNNNLHSLSLLPAKNKNVHGQKKNFNLLSHVFFHFFLSPFLNVNDIEWRSYFYGDQYTGGLFFYYGILNFGIGFNKSRFWDKCSSRIIGVNIFQFLGSFVLYFFIDKHETIEERWSKRSELKIVNIFRFLAFTEEYISDYVNSIDKDLKIKGVVKNDYFTKFISFIFAASPFFSLFTFDFQLFESLTFSLNVGSFVFLSFSFFICSIVKNFEPLLQEIKDAFSVYSFSGKNSKGKQNIIV